MHLYVTRDIAPSEGRVNRVKASQRKKTFFVNDIQIQRSRTYSVRLVEFTTVVTKTKAPLIVFEFVVREEDVAGRKELDISPVEKLAPGSMTEVERVTVGETVTAPPSEVAVVVCADVV